jgi:hypothetical protein
MLDLLSKSPEDKGLGDLLPRLIKLRMQHTTATSMRVRTGTLNRGDTWAKNLENGRPSFWLKAHDNLATEALLAGQDGLYQVFLG